MFSTICINVRKDADLCVSNPPVARAGLSTFNLRMTRIYSRANLFCAICSAWTVSELCTTVWTIEPIRRNVQWNRSDIRFNGIHVDLLLGFAHMSTFFSSVIYLCGDFKLFFSFDFKMNEPASWTVCGLRIKWIIYWLGVYLSCVEMKMN